MLLDDITINSDLICLGDFSADATMNKSVKGVLVYRHGKSYIKLFDYIPNKMHQYMANCTIMTENIFLLNLKGHTITIF